MNTISRHSRFTSQYHGRLSSWTTELLNRTGLVLAISRKGPRLIELMIRDGLLPPEFMNRVICEHALSFIDQFDGDLVVTDDSVNHGSTFSSILSLANLCYSASNASGRVLGVPFAVSDEASAKHREAIYKYFLPLRGAEVASFVYNEVCGFRLLAKPFDVEYPILTMHGEFSDILDVEAAITEISDSLNGKLSQVWSKTSTPSGQVESHSWTISFSELSNPSLAVAELRKLRIYIDEGCEVMRIVAMCPYPIPDSARTFGAGGLPDALAKLWNQFKISANSSGTQCLQRSTSRVLAICANYLAAMPLLLSAKTAFTHELSLHGRKVRCSGPGEADLRLLFGPRLATQVQACLDTYLQSENYAGHDYAFPPCQKREMLREECIPVKYAAKYEEKLSTLLSQSGGIDDAMRAVFYAQHTEIELPSRAESGDDKERLDFGITFGRIRELIRRINPVADEAAIHGCLDRLIDDACIVPRYLNMAVSGEPIWARAFRIGEGSTVKAAHAVRLLFEALSSKIESKDLPAELLEKFCVMALCVPTDHRDLTPLHFKELNKTFHLYGARVAISVGQNNPFLLDWAIQQGVVTKSRKGYRLAENVEVVYPAKECPWDTDVRNAVYDLATLVSSISTTPGLRDSALVSITSVASYAEFHKAIQGEMDLWLHHPVYSIYQCVRHMVELASSAATESLSKAQLEKANDLLANMANFPAQVGVKSRLWKELQQTIRKIDDVSLRTELTERIWNKIRPTLDSRFQLEKNSPGCTEMLSALRVAHRTNSVLRETLSLAGHSEPLQRSATWDESLQRLRNTLSGSGELDQVTLAMFRARDGRPAIDEWLSELQINSESGFSIVITQLRPVVFEIAYRCEEIFRDFGTHGHLDIPESLSPPRYLMMWDVRGSTDEQARTEIEKLIGLANSKIRSALGNRARNFYPENRDDGNGVICDDFLDILAVFQILNEVFHALSFRSGCEVNMQGPLTYYPTAKALGGRAFEHAARITSMFKELKSNPGYWCQGKSPEEPVCNYLIIGEFARRFQEASNKWPPQKGFTIIEPPGKFHARVRNALPIQVSILTMDSQSHAGDFIPENS